MLTRFIAKRLVKIVSRPYMSAMTNSRPVMFHDRWASSRPLYTFKIWCSNVASGCVWISQSPVFGLQRRLASRILRLSLVMYAMQPNFDQAIFLQGLRKRNRRHAWDILIAAVDVQVIYTLGKTFCRRSRRKLQCGGISDVSHVTHIAKQLVQVLIHYQGHSQTKVGQDG